MNPVVETTQIFYDPVLPPALLLLLGLLLAGATLAVYARDRRTTGSTRCLVLCLFRLLGLSAVFYLLLNPQKEVAKRVELLEQRVVIGLDTSASMQHMDDGQEARLDQARRQIDRARLIVDEEPAYPGLDFYCFDESARAVPAAALSSLNADGNDTRFHNSLGGMLNAAHKGQALAALILLTDGHDFELVNPARTALEAKARHCPLYILPVGSEHTVRDASIQIASYKPYVFAGQHARIDVALRLIGCEYEDFVLELYRDGKQIAQRQVAVGDELQRIESFEVMEKDPGQYAYEFRLSQVQDEVTDANNEAITFLNVSNKKINLLILEGSPYWDTNFTQRTLWSNEKFNIDSMASVARDKQIALRKDNTLGPLTLPRSAQEFDAYDCILLGRHVERLLDHDRQGALADYVQNYGGNLIFTRGQPMQDAKVIDALSPVDWGETVHGFAELAVVRAGRSLPPFELLDRQAGGRELHALFANQEGAPKQLTTVLASTQLDNGSEPLVAMAHRRAGTGQVMSISSTGLWRSGFHDEIPQSASIFDQFWDNLILWMISGRNAYSGSEYAVLLNTANLSLGQSLHMRMTTSQADKLPAGLEVEIYKSGKKDPVDRIVLAPSDKDYRLNASYTPEVPGLYRAALTLPNGEAKELRFAVYQDDQERSEVSVDRPYLERLAQLSGGRIIRPDELEALVKELLVREEPEPLKQREPTWDSPWLALLITGLLGMDWLLRRRWGLC
ncbi:hypothetical protein [Coraliomargarita parva]|uniref:hypothetical protein n=1 Tax=Coraliomargarita parva TaxID=3014050 RepID=UPI0022B38E79|nr:hypothetical protein [Coraliomargarita parva]